MVEQAQTADLTQALESLRGQGAQQRDPLRFLYLQSLAQRAQAQSEPVRRSLEVRLGAALAQWHATFEVPANEPVSDPHRECANGLRLLKALNRDLHDRNTDASAPANIDGSPIDPTELRSARAFKTEWSKQRALERVQTALDVGPDNAGPLNSHQLVLRAASQMRTMTPIYLERFLSHTDTLLWLDAVQLQASNAESASAAQRRKRPKK